MAKISETFLASHIWELAEINSGLRPDPDPGHGPRFDLDHVCDPEILPGALPTESLVLSSTHLTRIQSQPLAQLNLKLCSAAG